MTTVLTLIDYYLPGTNAGGALRSIANLVAMLGGELEFRIVTRDRDMMADEPYIGITPGTWESVGRAQVMYLSPKQASPATLRRIISETPHDVLYLNSLFSRDFTLSLLAYRLGGALPKRPVILAPRGQLAPGALAIKSGKKRAFLGIARAMRLYRDVTWQASSPDEAREIHEHFDSPDVRARVVVAPDLPTPWQELAGIRHRRKLGNALDVTFISRIVRKKNLSGAIELLRGLRAPATLDVFGPAEDAEYLRECEAAMATLPSHIRARYAGALAYEEIAPTFARYDLFLFPTLGENYGHVVIEALAAGCPVAVSDRMPFRDLEERGAGWVSPLEDPERYRAALERCAAMGPDEHGRMSTAAREYARRIINDPVPIDQNRHLFVQAAGGALSGHASQNIA